MPRLFALLTFVAATMPALSLANDRSADHEATVQMLGVAIRERIAVAIDKRTGRTIPAAHCRHAPGGCEKRVMVFARYLTESAERHGVDPWLMAAVAFRESAFNPFAMGSVGETGILQIHPGSPRAKNVRFLHDEGYRRRCRGQVGACQQEVVDHAAKVLARALSMCEGDVSDALGAYNTGRCGGNTRYSKRILETRAQLLEMVGLPQDAVASTTS